MKKIFIISLIVGVITYLFGSNTPFITPQIGALIAFVTFFVTAGMLLNIERYYTLPSILLLVVLFIIGSFIVDSIVAKQLALYPILGLITASIVLLFGRMIRSKEFDANEGVFLGAVLCGWLGYLSHLQLLKEALYLTIVSGVGFIVWAFIIYEQKQIDAWSQEPENPKNPEQPE